MSRSGDDLDISVLAEGEMHQLWIRLVHDATSRPVQIPVLVARGRRPGPTLGITAAVHGNELNGISIIHRLFRGIEPHDLKGTLVAVPVVNVPGYTQNSREFSDGCDLNRVFPGRSDGTAAEIYAHRFIDRVITKLDYLIDLHTASFGRVNSLYIRADMSHPMVAELSQLISPQIIVHNEGRDGTLRAAADELGIPAITVEVGDPNRFQRGFIRSSRLGIRAVLDRLDMFDHEHVEPEEEETIECAKSYWLYTDVGGVLRVMPDVAARVQQGERMAVLTNLFGDVLREYLAPQDAVVVGKSSNPVAPAGSRIIHLGIEGPLPQLRTETPNQKP